jgi:glutathione S-transferase
MKIEHHIELIGMMDSPFVRRVAIALTCYGLTFHRLPLSVYTAPRRLAAINPLLTAPVLRTRSLQLIDSRCILDWIDAQVAEPWLRNDAADANDSARMISQQSAAMADSLALKAGELYRESGLRPSELRSDAAVNRLQIQMSAVLLQLEKTANLFPALSHDVIAVATSYGFARMVSRALSVDLPATPTLSQQCATLEAQPALLACDPNS